MPLWVYIVCVMLICACAALWSYERRVRSVFKGIPTLPPLPIIGNIHQVLGDGRVLFRLLKSVAEICDTNNSPCIAWLGLYPIFITHDPEDVKVITNSCVEKPFLYNFGRVWLGHGLVTAPAAVWKHNIKKLSGTFTSSVVDGYLGVFNAQAEKLVAGLKTEVGKEPFDIINKYLAYTTLEAICQTALGVSKISESIVTSEYYEAFNRCLELLTARGLNVFLYPDVIYRLTPAHREIKRCVAIIHNVSETVMKKRKLEREEKKKRNKTKNENNGEEPRFKAFLDILMELSELDPSLTEQQIKSEVDTIIVGGQETVASTILFTLLMIGCKPGIQNKMYDEMRRIFGDSKRPVRKEDLSEMKYCEAVIYETLRLYPPVPGVMRYSDRDLQLKSCKIPKGTVCGISGWGAGRSTRTWGPDAALYRPERWLSDTPPGNPAGFLAFSYGRRACIGKKYAMAILKTILAHCLRELEFVSQADNMQMKIDIALRPISGHLIQVRQRIDDKMKNHPNTVLHSGGVDIRGLLLRVPDIHGVVRVLPMCGDRRPVGRHHYLLTRLLQRDRNC
ncbi:cytochrome P450 4c21-like [Trichoplusia ni]|uniref:Cytochrome P450 4c21-like n=1 Tax=Trichoplusia ni TaxID=7111 RepID=A0A7E5WLS6_TRINI|nr:cytochrome P450 4c21-like [Trichoplusia ni]